MIPLYKYDPAEELAWGDREEEELTVRRLPELFFVCHRNSSDWMAVNSCLFPTGTFEPGRKTLALISLWNKQKIKWRDVKPTVYMSHFALQLIKQQMALEHCLFPPLN